MNRAGHHIFVLWFLLSIFFFFFFSSPILSRRTLDVYHASTHSVALVRIYDAGLKHVARCSQKIQDAKKMPKIRHLSIIARLCRAISWQLKHIDSPKKLLNSNISPTCPHNMVNFGPLEAEIGSVVWGTPANFNWFRILASLLQRHCSTEANQTLHDVWPSPVLVHYIYIFGGSCPVLEFCEVQNSLCIYVLCSPILVALLYGTRVVGMNQTLQHWAEGL